MKYIALVATLFLLCHCRTYQATTAQNKQPDTLIRLYAFGLPNFQTYQEESGLAFKWGFYWEEMGCVLSNQEQDSLEAINKLAEQPLVNKYGKNWKKKFFRELRVVTASPERAIDLVAYEELVAIKWMDMEKHGDSVFYHFKPTKHHGIYYVDVVGYQNNEWVSFFNYKVNYINQKATLKRKTIKTDPSYLTDNLYLDMSHNTVIPR